MKKYKDTEYLQATARVRALENKMVKAADFQKMAEAKNAEEAYKVISEAPLCQGYDIADYSKALDRSLEEAYQLVSTIAPDTGLVRLFRCKYDGHNIKTAIKATKADTDSTDTYMPLGNIPVDTVLEAVASGDYGTFPPVFAEAAVEAAEALAKTGNPQAVDIILDKAVLRELAAIAVENGNPFLTRFVTAQVDIANIRAAVRVKRMGKDVNFLNQVLTEGGEIDPHKLREASLREGWDELLEVIAGTAFGSVLEPSFTELREGGSLTQFEKLCDNVLVEMLRATKFVPFGIEALVAYLYGKECEAKAARIIMASKLAGVGSQQILERLREIYG